MEKLIIGSVVAVFIVYAAPVFACDCDTAAAITSGMRDRLHQPWPSEQKDSTGKSKSSENGPKQEVQPMNQDSQPKGQTKQ